MAVREDSPFPDRSKSIKESGKAATSARILRRLGPLTERNFRVFYAGYTTSLLGSAMSAIALTFAVLDSGGSAADLGFVFAANVVPQVLVMIGGGVVADRLGRRPVMLITDTARLAVQGALATALFMGRPPIWLFVMLAALLGAGEGIFGPALGGLRAEIAPREKLPDANALLGVAQSGTTVLGPALAGLLIGLTSPAVVIAVDAATFGVSVLSLALLAIAPARRATTSPWRDLADGWAQFRAQTWLCLITVQFALFNLLTWAPFLLLGPILARQYLGGARAWGIISAAMAAGSVVTGLVLVGRRPRRLLVVATIGTFGYAAPCLMLALRVPVYVVAAGALAAGVGSAVFNTYSSTAMQQRVPAEMLGRATAFTLTGAYALGATGYAVIGSVAGLVGPGRMLAFAAGYCVLSSALVLAAPAIRAVTWRD
ncbi:MAG TPA: MFS transporter [Streptosporangiaceae bacterium]